MILSDCVKIKNINDLSTEYVENELKKLGIEPIRWAITAQQNDTLIVSLAYERD